VVDPVLFVSWKTDFIKWDTHEEDQEEEVVHQVYPSSSLIS